MHIPSPVTAEHIGYAVIRLREIEGQSANGGKRGSALVAARIDQKRHVAELLDAFDGGVRRREGREGDEGSTPVQVATAAE